ncbi:hypothetical protein BY458DRAFT_560504 [Sporodiniella umbellata]|nr:hypothetical protein BY458DRAFT_560504 [Sporodiniella umbellata]
MTTLQVYAHRLSDSSLSPNLRVTIANELRDQVELFQTLEYPRFLSTLLPVFIDILQNGNPVFTSGTSEQKLRNIILEIIYRLPQTEPLKEYAHDLSAMLMQLIRVENEENAVVCAKIIIDLHRAFRSVLEDQVEPFLEIVLEIFKNMEQTVKDLFDVPCTPIGSATPNPLLASPNSPADIPEPSKPLQKSMYSFKVLTECPIIVVLLFQTNRRIATDNIMKFVPLIFQVLGLQAKPQAEAASAAQARSEVFVGVCPEIRNRSVYNDFIVAQVKTMSFLAYILRSYTALLRPFQHQIPDFALRLLRECPPESTSTRKELLVAIRHILSTDFRASFIPKIDLLLNEKVLIGTGVTSHETLRPLAYSMLADLVHHIRSDLSPTQLYRTVYMYSRNLHDATLASSIQTMCGKLLLNLIDCIIKIPNKAEARALLMRILDAFASKFASLNILFKTCLKQHIKKNSLYPIKDSFDYDQAKSIQTTMDPQHEGIKDGRFLFKNFTAGLKSLFIGLRHCNPPIENTTQQYAQFARGFSQQDIHILVKLFKEGLVCFEYYNIDLYGPDGSLPSEKINYDELKKTSIGCNELSLKIGTQASTEKETLETFATVFTLLDPAVFQEIFVSQMPFFFDRMLINTSLVHIVQYFLVNEVSSQGLACILFRFLVDRLDRLGGDNMHYSAVQLHLFRLSFMAINLFPDMIEPVLQPYLSSLVSDCFKLSTQAQEPANFFLLLRAMFKSIGGGRFELLYKEVGPLLHMILESLNALLTLAHTPEMRHLFVELALAVPVRLSTLLPYLPYLMKPLVIALQADHDLVSQGLRTIELCNDNLNPEFLDSVMEPVMQELMTLLYRLLKPVPFNQQISHAAMRIIGKFGGRNRRVLNTPSMLQYDKHIESGLSLEIIFDPKRSQTHSLPLNVCLEAACNALVQIDTFYRRHAYNFIKLHIVSMLSLDKGPTNLADILSERIQIYLTTEDKKIEPMDTDESTQTKLDDLRPKRLEKRGYTKYLNKRLAQEEAFRTMLIAILKATTYDSVKDDAWPFFQHLCRHFMLLHITEAIEAKRSGFKPLSNIMEEKPSPQILSNTLLVDAIVNVMSSEDFVLRERAEEALQLCFDTAVKVLGEKEYVSQLPIFRMFASQFSSYCYKQEWHQKRGGCLGISLISSQLDMGIRWMREHEVDFIRALLFVLKDASPEMVNVNTTEATQTLSHVLKVCNRPDDEESIEGQQKFQNLIALLLSELSNSNSIVRETIQSSFQLLADLTGNEVTELLAPVRERLVAPIFAKPLRALPFAMQIGHIDAITYCLTLRPPFLEFNDELIRLLHEALALADAEDQDLVSKGSQHKNEVPLMNLRIVCIRLLSAAMACSDFSNPRQNQTRARIFQVFFKSLHSDMPDVVEAAHRGIKQVLSPTNKLPKDLLQQGLRPILTTLASHKTLSLAGLEGLARLLELLTNYFKVEIGKKLLDHLKLWAEPSVLQEAANGALNENGDVKIMAAILNVFYLLPPTAHIFMDEFIQAVLEMEVHLRRSFSSPFRPNVIKYLNRYPTEAVAYFFERLDKPAHALLLIDVLNAESAVQVREEITKSTEILVKAFQSDHRYQAVLVVQEMMRHDSDWLSSQPDILNCLVELWKSPSRFPAMRKDDAESVRFTLETQIVSQIFIAYLHKNQDNVDLIFDIAQLLSEESVMDLSYLRDFFFNEMALNYPENLKRQVLERFLEQFHEYSSTFRMTFLRHVINPCLLYSLSSEHTEVLDATIMEQLVRKVWSQPALDGTENQYADDSLRIELLQLTAIIVQYAPELMTDYRKEVIKFGWNYIRLDDSTCKQAAYILVARFITAFETPTKIVIQVYAALLRAHLSEARLLVKQGLDIVSPMLPARIQQAANERVPTWVRLTRKVLVEDTHSISQMVNVYQLLVRHADLFYDYREHFLPHIVNALPKLGLYQNATPENKLLTVELAELIQQWEQKRLKATDAVNISGKRVVRSPLAEEESPAKKTKLEGGGKVELKPRSDKDYAPPLALRESMTGYLVRLACAIYNPSDATQRKLVQRVLELINQLLSIWVDVHIKLIHLERALTIKEVNDILVSSICSALEILCVDIGRKPVDWFLVNLGPLFRLLENSIKSDHVRIHTSLQPVLSHIFGAINLVIQPDKEPQPEVASFTALVESTITDGMASANNIYGVLKLLQAYSTGRKERLDMFVPGIVKLLQKLTQTHLVTQSSNMGAVDSQVNLLVLCLGLLKTRISHLADQRRGFLICLTQLIEKSPDIQLLHVILDMLKEWTLNRKEAFPTIKEKAGLLMKMMSFHARQNDRLTEDYLDLILKIYSQPAFARTEMTVRLEEAFLCGVRSENPQVQSQFMRVFDRSLSRSVYDRLQYIIGTQNWEPLSEGFWIHQALDLLLGAVQTQPDSLPPYVLKTLSLQTEGDVADKAPEALKQMVEEHQQFLETLAQCDTQGIVYSVRHLQYLDDDVAFQLWVDLFPIAWSGLNTTEQHDLGKTLIELLAKEYHDNTSSEVNVIQALLAGLARAQVDIKMPPHLIKHLGKTHNAWYTSIDILQRMVDQSSTEGEGVLSEERTLDALADLFSCLKEDDMFCGLWRRHCHYTETNVALSFEQASMWSEAQAMYEKAQIKARHGVLNFTESEYTLWETHWISCTEQLQQWDVLADLAKYDNDPKLYLDSAWRLSDWEADRETLEPLLAQVEASAESKIYEAFLILLKSEDRSEFTRVCEEGIQLALKRWSGLPLQISNSHIALLQIFQQYLELHEASQIFTSLSGTNAQNFEQRSTDLKSVLGSWRERLPNAWDEMHAWSQLVSWRQHVFSAINRTYVPLSQNSGGFRGYHETAWLINRFSHVARKHDLDGVCSTTLAKIYTLPNIEVQESYQKLREQVKCHFKDQAQLKAGLDVVNNTNLSYFNKEQKAEFYVLKGQFLAKLDYLSEANEAFVTAAQIEVAHGRAWAAWGEYNDRRFKQSPHELHWATHAVSCYLQAAGTYKNARSRQYLLRILWLLSLDDTAGTISSAFEVYKGEIPVWYWITFIPQLLMGVQQKEGKHVKAILMRIAKQYPQALHFQLRTAKEEVTKRTAIKPETVEEEKEEAEAISPGEDEKMSEEEKTTTSTLKLVTHPFDEIMAMLKTGYPLLALSMETMVDQIQLKFKPQADEDMYRLVVALYNEGIQQLLTRLTQAEDTLALTPATMSHITRFADSLYPGHMKTAFVRDFASGPLSLEVYVGRLRVWRDTFEAMLDARPRQQKLEGVSHYLVEFQHQKFDDVEIPGQYLLLNDNANGFLRIDRFLPEIEVVRSDGHCFRRVTIRGHDGSLHPFVVQNPAARQFRREERLMQLFRLLNGVLGHQRESRKRHLSFSLPCIVPLAPNVRLVSDDVSYCSLYAIYEDHCDQRQMHKDEPLVYFMEQLKQAVRKGNPSGWAEIRAEIYREIEQTRVPNHLLSGYMLRTLKSFGDYWLHRQRFMAQYATATVMSYLLSLGHRTPHKLTISRETGHLWMTELLPSWSQHGQLGHGESVPFRLTPNLQAYMGAMGQQGLFSSSVLATARALTGVDLEQYLPLFVRDELISWHTANQRPTTEAVFRERVQTNVQLVVNKARFLACRETKSEDQAIDQAILDLIQQAIDPQAMAQMDCTWMPWL